MPTLTAPRFATIATATTREQRIGVVAHRWNRQYRYDAQYKAAGFSDDEIAEGDALGYLENEEHFRLSLYYGDPAYGSWPKNAKTPVRDKIRDMMRIA